MSKGCVDQMTRCIALGELWRMAMMNTFKALWNNLPHISAISFMFLSMNHDLGHYSVLFLGFALYISNRIHLLRHVTPNYCQEESLFIFNVFQSWPRSKSDVMVWSKCFKSICILSKNLICVIVYIPVLGNQWITMPIISSTYNINLTVLKTKKF